MKILCIPDVYGRKFLREVIKNNESKVDKVIFLGDYLDSYYNEYEENPESLELEYFGDSESLCLMIL